MTQTYTTQQAAQALDASFPGADDLDAWTAVVEDLAASWGWTAPFDAEQVDTFKAAHINGETY